MGVKADGLFSNFDYLMAFMRAEMSKQGKKPDPIDIEAATMAMMAWKSLNQKSKDAISKSTETSFCSGFWLAYSLLPTLLEARKKSDELTARQYPERR